MAKFRQICFQAFKALFQVGDQIGRIFQPGMNAQHRPFRRERPHVAPDMRRNDQAFKPAPGIADAEMLQPIDKAATAASETGLRMTPNRPQAPEKSRFHRVWPGSSGSAGCRMRATSGRAFSQRASVSAGLLMLLQPHGQGAQAPQAQKTVIAAGEQAHIAMGLVQARGMFLVGGDITQHHIGMATDIFGGGLDGEVHAMR